MKCTVISHVTSTKSRLLLLFLYNVFDTIQYYPKSAKYAFNGVLPGPRRNLYNESKLSIFKIK